MYFWKSPMCCSLNFYSHYQRYCALCCFHSHCRCFVFATKKEKPNEIRDTILKHQTFTSLETNICVHPVIDFKPTQDLLAWWSCSRWVTIIHGILPQSKHNLFVVTCEISVISWRKLFCFVSHNSSCHSRKTSANDDIVF